MKVSWRQSSASAGPIHATRKRWSSAAWASTSVSNGGSCTLMERAQPFGCEVGGSDRASLGGRSTEEIVDGGRVVVLDPVATERTAVVLPADADARVLR